MTTKNWPARGEKREERTIRTFTVDPQDPARRQMRGTFPPAAVTCKLTRQLLRAAIRTVAFAEVTKNMYHRSRRERRALARLGTVAAWQNRRKDAGNDQTLPT